MATPSGPGNVGTAADALIQAGGGIYDEMEEDAGHYQLPHKKHDPRVAGNLGIII